MLKKEEYIKQLYETEQELIEMSNNNPILDADYINTIITKIDNVIVLILDDEYILTDDDKEDVLDMIFDCTGQGKSWEQFKDNIQKLLTGKIVKDADDSKHIPHID